MQWDLGETIQNNQVPLRDGDRREARAYARRAPVVRLVVGPSDQQMGREATRQDSLRVHHRS